METYNKQNIDLEIETLLNTPHHLHDEVQIEGVWNLKNATDVGYVTRRVRSSDSVSSTSSLDENELVTVTVNGADIGDLPIEYEVQGLKPYELPVKGTYVDGCIIPGFKYKIRMLGSNEYLFKGKPVQLVSVGQGYGKRITVNKAIKHRDLDYFYSDTHPHGYGFEMIPLAKGDKFDIINEENFAVGKATIDSVQRCCLVKTEADNGLVKKLASVNFVCSVEFESNPHGLMPLCTNHSFQLNGLVNLEKERTEKEAKPVSITNVNLQYHGICSFEPFD